MSNRHLMLCLAIVAAGCGQDGPQLGEVAGTVTMDGKPVAGATVCFTPHGSAGSPSYGETDKSGEYSLGFTRKQTGAMIGDHDVTIETIRPTKAEVNAQKASGGPAPEFVEIPKRYRVPGALTAKVSPGWNTLDFELTSSK